jgi:pyruvate/2-oxoglutarate/acetoin dehydrogenase E1 component
MAELSYRESIGYGMAQELARDPRVVLVGEDVGAAGHVFKSTVGLLDRFGPERVRDTPISEQAFVGAAMGAAMTGLRPIVMLMYADFLGVCWDMVANEIAKTRYMTGGQVTIPLVLHADSGAGLRMGAQHSQSVENWAMAIPGLKVAAPSTPADVVGLMAAAVRSDDPVLVLTHKYLYSTKGEVPDGEVVGELGKAAVRRSGTSATVVALGAMVPEALRAAEILEPEGISLEVIDLRTLVPLDVTTVLESVGRTSRLFTVEENPRLCGWGAEVASIVAEEAVWSLDGPIIRITTPHVPVPAAPNLEDATLPRAERIAERIRRGL